MTEQIEKTLKNFSKKIGISFKKNNLLQEALTHRSFINETKKVLGNINHNERLEFLGDAVLELITTEFLFDKYKTYSEGQLTSFRSALVRTESLAEEALKFNLGEYIFMSKGEELTGGRTRPYILANTVEALIGAIYLDRGINKSREFIIQHICYKIDKIIKERSNIDAKTLFQEIAQDKAKITPIYKDIRAFGPDHDKRFEMAVMLGDFEFGKGIGKSKQQAEQMAASDAIEHWDLLYPKYFG